MTTTATTTIATSRRRNLKSYIATRRVATNLLFASILAAFCIELMIVIHLTTAGSSNGGLALPYFQQTQQPQQQTYNTTSISHRLISFIKSHSLLAILPISNNHSALQQQKRTEEEEVDAFAYQYGGKERVEMALQKLPPWVRDYLKWHKEQRATSSATTTKNNNYKTATPKKYLISHCLKGQRCGGTSDRLQTLPFLLLLANMTRRILLIHWDKPYPLQEFLVPPENGLDWRVQVPFDNELLYLNKQVLMEYMFDGGCKSTAATTITSTTFRQCVQSFVQRDYSRNGGNRKQFLSVRVAANEAILESHLLFHYYASTTPTNSSNAAAVTNNNNVSNPFNNNNNGEENQSFFLYFGEIFRIFFEPSPPISKLYQSTMKQFQLSPGRYTSAHVRARFPNIKQNLQSKIVSSMLSPPSNSVATNTSTSSQKNVPPPRLILPPILSGNKMVDKPGGLLFEGATKKMVIEWSDNAIACATYLSSLSPTTTNNSPIYFASDSNDTVAYIIQHSHRSVVGLVGDEPLHIDYEGYTGEAGKILLQGSSSNNINNSSRGGGSRSDISHLLKNVSNFYSGFVDLLILGSSKCVTYGMGGYGRFGAALSQVGSTPCRIKHRGYSRMNICPAVSPPPPR